MIKRTVIGSSLIGASRTVTDVSRTIAIWAGPYRIKFQRSIGWNMKWLKGSDISR